jgi:hypothetical protein
MTRGDGNAGDPLLVRRYLREPDNVDGPPPSDATWPAVPAPAPAPAPPPLSRAQRDRTAAALNWPTLKWFTQKPPVRRNRAAPPEWPPAAPPPVPPQPRAFPEAPNAGPNAGWAAADYPTEVLSYVPMPLPVPGPPAQGTAPVAPARPRPSRKRRTLVLACSAVAAVLAIGGAGFMDFVSGDGDQTSPIGLPAGPAPSSSDGLTAPANGSAPAGSPASRGASSSPGARSTATGADGLSSGAGDTDAAVPPAGLPVAPPAPGSPSTAVPPGEPALVAPTGDPAARTPPPAGAAVSTGAITGPGGLCLAGDGSRVRTATCDGGAAQNWTVGGDGTLRVSGRCADAGADSVSIVTCGGAATSQWRSGSNRSVVNAGTGECLTDPVGGTRAGTTVTVTRCSGGTNQQWSLP